MARYRPSPTWSLLRIGPVLNVWIWWERLLDRLQRIRPIRPGAVMRYSFARHRGRARPLRDGTVVARGDRIIELHFDNRRLAELAAARMPPWALLRLMAEDLAALGQMLAEDRLGDASALHGVTMFASAAPRLGFETQPLARSRYNALQRFFMAGLVMLYHPGGWAAARRHASRWPGEVWMSRAALAGLACGK